MPMRRKSHQDEMPPSRVRPCLKVLGEWERRMVRKYGLDDIPWDPQKCCELCIAERAGREEVEELVPPSGSRPNLLRLGWAKTPPRVGGRTGWSKRRGKLTLVKLVRSPRGERTDS